MTTSGTYTVTLTFTQLLTDALVDIGILDAVESPDSNQTTVGMRKFNNLLFQLKGPKAHFLPSERGWLRESVSVTPSASLVAYALKPSGGQAAIQIPSEILRVALKKTSTSDEQALRPITMEEYHAIANKAQTGTPTMWAYEKRLDQVTLYVDQKCTATIVSGYTLEVLYRQPLEVVTSGAETMDLPFEWYRALEWTLARELAPGYTVDEATWQRVQQMAAEALGLSNNAELENAPAYYQCKKDIDD